MKLCKKTTFLVVICLQIATEILYAQNKLDSLQHLPEVVVTGTGTEHYMKDAPVQTEVISGKALRNYSGRSIEDILSALSPSFSFNKSDMGSGIQLNGLGNNYILILLDGKKINGDLGGQNDLNTINIANIERIEIVKGAASALYGSDAIAGVVNFITRKNNAHVNISNLSRVGYYGDFLQNNTVSFKTGHLNATTSINFKRTDGRQNTTHEWYRHNFYENSVSRTTNRSHNYKIAQSLTYEFSKKLSLKGDISYYQRWVHRPSGFPQWQLKNFHYRDENYSLDATYRLSKKNTLSVDVSYGSYNYFYDYTQREYTDFFDKNGIRIVFYPGDHILQSSQRRLLSRAKGVFRVGDKHIVSGGIEHNTETLISPLRLVGNERVSSYTLSAYAQDEINVTPDFNITPGVRFVHHKAFGQIATPKVSIMYKLGDFNLRGTYSYGFKAPTVKELYYSYLATIMTRMKAYYGNENLRPQLSNYYALGVEYHGVKLKTNFTVYYNGVRNMIALQPIPTSPQDKLLEVEETMQYANLAKARSFGADFTFAITLHNNFSLGGGYSYNNAKAQDSEQLNFLEYKPINGTSFHNATFRASWEHDWGAYKLGVSVFGRYQSKRFYITDGDTKPYQLWRINTAHSFLHLQKFKINMNVGVDNIFNYVDKTPFGRNRATSTPGRTFYASVALQFENKKDEKTSRQKNVYMSGSETFDKEDEN